MRSFFLLLPALAAAAFEPQAYPDDHCGLNRACEMFYDCAEIDGVCQQDTCNFPFKPDPDLNQDDSTLTLYCADTGPLYLRP